MGVAPKRKFFCWRTICVRQLERLIEGEKVCMPRADHVSKVDVEKTMHWLCKKFNEAVSEEHTERDRFNKELANQFVAGTMDIQEMATKWMNKPKRLKVKDFHNFAKHFLKKKKFTKQACNTSGNYLSYDDEKMEEPLN